MLYSAHSSGVPEAEELTPSLDPSIADFPLSSSLAAIDGEPYDLFPAVSTLLLDRPGDVSGWRRSPVTSPTSDVTSGPDSCLTSPSQEWPSSEFHQTSAGFGQAFSDFPQTSAGAISTSSWLPSNNLEFEHRSVSAPVTPEDLDDKFVSGFGSIFVGSHSWDSPSPLTTLTTVPSAAVLDLSDSPEPQSNSETMGEHPEDTPLSVLNSIPLTVLEMAAPPEPQPVGSVACSRTNRIPLTVTHPPSNDVKSHLKSQIMKRCRSYPGGRNPIGDIAIPSRTRTKSEGAAPPQHQPGGLTTSANVRMAGQRWRVKKKEEFLTLNKEFTTSLSQNTQLKYQVAQLQKELQRLQDVFSSHLNTCTRHVTRPRDSASAMLPPL